MIGTNVGLFVCWSSPLCPLLDVHRSNIRVFEYHEYTVGGEVCDPTHSDGGSLVTMSVLLNDKVYYLAKPLPALPLPPAVLPSALPTNWEPNV